MYADQPLNTIFAQKNIFIASSKVGVSAVLPTSGGNIMYYFVILTAALIRVCLRQRAATFAPDGYTYVNDFRWNEHSHHWSVESPPTHGVDVTQVALGAVLKHLRVFSIDAERNLTYASTVYSF